MNSKEKRIFMNGTRNIITDSYEIKEKLGEGGFGCVYAAYHKNLRKKVVIKVLKSNLLNENQRRTEVDIMKNLRHSYIPSIVDYFEIDNYSYTVMDYIEGKTFAQLLNENVSFNEDKVKKYFVQLCEAVEYLHTQKIPIIHGDIKPGNIILTKEDNICLIDFNISGISYNGKAYTDGYTPGYSAPEQLAQYNAIVADNNSGKDNNFNRCIVIDKRTDVYSIAATMFRILTGQKYVSGTEYVLESKLSEGLVQVLNKGLNSDPSKRYADASIMLDDLKKSYKYDKSYRRKKLLKWFAGIAIVLTICTTAFFCIQIRDKKIKEIDLQYKHLIYKMEDARGDYDFQKVCDYYDDAIELRDDKIDAYLQMSLAYFETGNYNKTIRYIENEVLNNSQISKKEKSDIYYILGRSYSAIEDYDKAIEYYDKAIKYNDKKATYYVDEAVAKARINQYEDAEILLKKARELDDNNSNVKLIQAEIFFAKHNYYEAIDCYKDFLKIENDKYERLCAYVMIAKSYEMENKSKENYDNAINILRSAESEFSNGYKDVLLQNIARLAIDASDLYNGSGYEEIAIDMFDYMIANGNDDITTYENKVIMLQKIENYVEARNVIDEMKQLYELDYRVYKRAAFLELEMQDKISSEERDYSDFENYYLKMKNLFDSKHDANDSIDIQRLDSLYQQLKDGNWL